MGIEEINGTVGDEGEGQHSQRRKVSVVRREGGGEKIIRQGKWKKIEKRREEEKLERDHMVPGRKSNILRNRSKKSQLFNQVEEPRSSVKM